MLTRTMTSRLVTCRIPRTMMMKARAFSGIEVPLANKEKVEEDRFVRAKTSEQLQKIRQDMADATAAVQGAKDAKHYAEHIQPSINEVKALLRPNETLSDETLLRIVKWNMGI